MVMRKGRIGSNGDEIRSRKKPQALDYGHVYVRNGCKDSWPKSRPENSPEPNAELELMGKSYFENGSFKVIKI